MQNLKNVTLVPQLEIQLSLPLDSGLSLCRETLTSLLLPIMNQDVEYIITSNKTTDENTIRCTEDSITSLITAFLSAIPPIRFRPSSIIVSRSNTNKGSSGIDYFRLTIGINAFPDSPLATELCIRTSSENAWAHLKSLRTQLLEMYDHSAMYTNLGFSFHSNLDRFYDACQEISNTCMRYLGANIDDPFGFATHYGLHGPRTISWQTGISQAVMENAFKHLPIARQNQILAGSFKEAAMYIWQSSIKPSICDRNNPNDHDEIESYTQLHEKLAPMLYLYPITWLPKFDNDIAERWGNRWGEIKHA